MNILLLNLTRFGDLLQSQAAINALAGSGVPGSDPPSVPYGQVLPGLSFASLPAQGVEPSALAPQAASEPDAALARGLNRVGLVCLANFAFTSVFLQNISTTFPLPKDAFLAGLLNDVADPGPRPQPDREGAAGELSGAKWARAISALWQWRSEIWSDFKPDLVCNLTPSLPARLLSAYLAGGAPVSGFGLDEWGFSEDSPWAAYLQGASRRRELSPFNVVDVFRAVAGTSGGRAGDSLLLPRPQEDLARMGSRPHDELERVRTESRQMDGSPALEECKGFVAFQPGASAARRRWPLEYFFQVGQALWREFHLVPVLLGSKGELELAGRYADLSEQAAGRQERVPHLSLVGATGLEDLAAALGNCKLLISNDTGTMHLAAGLGIPVLGIFLSTAQPWDTGPSLPGSCALEPGLDCHPCDFSRECPYDLRCRHSIRPELVYGLARDFLRQGLWRFDREKRSAAATADATAETRIWLTEQDHCGFLTLRSLSGHEQEARTQWFIEQRDFLRQFLDRDQTAQFVLRGEGSELRLPAEQREKLSAELTYFADRLQSLLEQGKLLEFKPLPRFRELFLQSVAELSRNFESSRFFGSLGFIWRIEVHERAVNLAAALRCIAAYKSLIDGLGERLGWREK